MELEEIHCKPFGSGWGWEAPKGDVGMRTDGRTMVFSKKGVRAFASECGMQVGGVASSGYVYKYPHFPLVLYTLPLSGTSQRHAAATALMLSAREGSKNGPCSSLLEASTNSRFSATLRLRKWM